MITNREALIVLEAAIRMLDSRYFVGPDDLINDLETFGFLFETLCVRDLRVYADALDGKVYHYRDKDGLECDAVIHRRDGSYAFKRADDVWIVPVGCLKDE